MAISTRTRITAGDLGQLCLDRLIQDPPELARFMAASGLDPGGVWASRRSPALALGAIDYVAANEPLLLSVCEDNGIRPDDFMRVWQRKNRAE